MYNFLSIKSENYAYSVHLLVFLGLGNTLKYSIANFLNHVHE